MLAITCLKFGYCLECLRTLKLAILFFSIFLLVFSYHGWAFPIQVFHYLLYHMFQWAACAFFCYCSKEPTEPFTYLDLESSEEIYQPFYANW